MCHLNWYYQTGRLLEPSYAKTSKTLLVMVWQVGLSQKKIHKFARMRLLARAQATVCQAVCQAEPRVLHLPVLNLSTVHCALIKRNVFGCNNGHLLHV